MTALIRRRLRLPAAFVLVLLAIELLDELVFGMREAAWPLVRNDLGLNYVQIGLLLSIPELVASLIEPVLGILADTWKRRVLILGGGVCFAIACFLSGVSTGFIPLLIAMILFYPASGAFVALSQAALMDHDPARHEHNMARWTLAGSVGVVGGPLLLGAGMALGIGWRGVYVGLAIMSLALVVVAWRFPFPNGASEAEADAPGFWDGVKNALTALRRGAVLRWFILLEFSNFMLDILLGYLALYFVDVVGVNEAEAGIAVAIWTGVGLLGDILLIPLLERVRGLVYLRYSAAIELVLFVAFLLAEPIPLKLALLGLVGFFNSGWYSILQGQVYTAMPGQSGTVMALDNIVGFFTPVIPLLLGALAERFGLGPTLWLLLLGPIALLIGIPRQGKGK
ncbi:MAG: MFS transporter [Anaerolineae bacterium]|nr:MFS transporter [Anaerolineae bacterium]